MNEIKKNGPGKSKTTVLLLAILGYAYIAIILISVLLLLIWSGIDFWFGHFQNSVSARLFIFGLFMLYVLLRGMFFKLQLPEGIEVTRERAPRLFELIEELRKIADIRVDQVFITNQINASVFQYPRLGLFGWYKNILTIGLPLMEILSPDECRGVLGHEFGHFSKAHGRFGFWIYHLRTSWTRIVWQRGLNRSVGSVIFVPFFNWFMPILDRQSLALTREHEYEADRLAVQFAGPTGQGAALVKMELADEKNDKRFQPAFRELVKADPDNHPGYLTGLLEDLKKDLPPEKQASCLRQALNRRSQEDDTHPSLQERLTAMGFQADESGIEKNGKNIPIGAPEGPSSALEYLGRPLTDEILNDLDKKWREKIDDKWKKYGKTAKTKQEELAVWMKESNNRQKTVPEWWYQIILLDDSLGSRSEIEKCLRAILEMEPKQPAAMLRLGGILLEKEGGAGVVLLEGLVQNQTYLALLACKKLVDYFDRTGNQGKRQIYLEKIKELSPLFDAAGRDRADLSVAIGFSEHELDAFTVGKIAAQLEDLRDYLEKVYLVQRKMKRIPDWKAYYLVVRTKVPWYRLRGGKKSRELKEKIMEAVRFRPFNGSVYFAVDDSKGCQRLAKQIKGSLIYAN